MKKLLLILSTLTLVLFFNSCSKEEIAEESPVQTNPGHVYATSRADFENYNVPTHLTQRLAIYDSLSTAYGLPNFNETYGDIILNIDFRHVTEEGDVLRMYMVMQEEELRHILVAAHNTAENRAGAFIVNEQTDFSEEGLS